MRLILGILPLTVGLFTITALQAHPDLDGVFTHDDPFMASKLNQLKGRVWQLEQNETVLKSHLKALEKKVFPPKVKKNAKVGHRLSRPKALEKRKA